jgi:hypothetical protein
VHAFLTMDAPLSFARFGLPAEVRDPSDGAGES